MKISPKHCWTQEEINLFKSKYGLLTLSEIHQKYFKYLSLSQIKSAPSRLGLIIPGIRTCKRIQKYTYNTHFWNDVDEIRAYWGGYIAADGSILRKGSYNWILGLSTIDQYFISQFIQDCDYTGNFYIEAPRQNHLNRNQVYVINIRGIQHDWLKPLQEIYNIIPNKTKFLQPPNLTNINHILAYIKGYIDGDGTICYKNNRFRISICAGIPTVLEWMLEHMRKNIDMKNTKISKRNKRELYELTCASNIALGIGKIINRSSIRGLPRKWNQLIGWEKYKEEYNNKYYKNNKPKQYQISCTA